MGAAIPMVAGAALGAIQGNEERKQTERFNKGAAEANRYADVTGNSTELRQDKSGGLFGGALKGAGSFAGLGQAFGGKTPPIGVQKSDAFVEGIASQNRKPGAFGGL